MIAIMTAVRRAPRDSKRSDDARRVRDLLRSALNSDVYPDGKLPDETRLMDEFAVSRSAVRDALTMLSEEGLVDRRKGLGTLVVHTKTVMELSENHGVADPAPGSVWSGQMRIRILDWTEVRLPQIAAHRLDTAAGERSLRIDYIAILDGSPLALATNYVRWPQAGALHPSLLQTDWYAMFDVAGLPIGETTFLWEAAIADAQDSTLLEVPVGAPIMLGEQVIYAPDGAAYDFALTRGRGDRMAMFSRATRRNPA
jgi:GntR family transcriptional regulator